MTRDEAYRGEKIRRMALAIAPSVVTADLGDIADRLAKLGKPHPDARAHEVEAVVQFIWAMAGAIVDGEPTP